MEVLYDRGGEMNLNECRDKPRRWRFIRPGEDRLDETRSSLPMKKPSPQAWLSLFQSSLIGIIIA